MCVEESYMVQFISASSEADGVAHNLETKQIIDKMWQPVCPEESYSMVQFVWLSIQ